MTSAGSGAASGSSGSGGLANAAGSAGDGGEAGEGGGGGEGGETGQVVPPDTRKVELVRDKVPNKLDLLMMIDNSISMTDKQHLLADAMEHLVDRLLQPRCLDTQGVPTGQQASSSGVCPANSHPEFLPFNDIHAAVVTSSLGSHGANGAKDICVAPSADDHGQLLGIIRPSVPNWNASGFLAWDPEQKLSPVGTADAAVLAADLAKTVEAAGDKGCGYEAVLEGWYRFLVDPEPPAAVVVPSGSAQAQVQGVSAEVLAQRKAFLRPDSVLGIVMLSDENDCSIIDSGYGWLTARSAPMFRSTSQCRTNPNDPCCQSCAETTAHAGCPAIASDSECAKGSALGASEDDLNLRCYHQKQRFGFELLYPVQRYIDALTAAQIKRRSDGALVTNPIYAGGEGTPPRSPEQVLLLGIVGVPWQDVADADSLTGAGLKFLSEDGVLPSDRWDVILGNPEASPPVLPLDPFMIESPDDRTTLPVPQANPLLPNQKLAPSSSQNPQANLINGHEQITQGRDLQYACAFALPTPILCDRARFDADESCDCFAEDATYNRPLCQPPGGGAAGISQYYGKAYPGLRELMVLKGVGGHGIVGSACAKTADGSSPTYGYRPSMDALAGRIAKQIGRSCLTIDAGADGSGKTPCSVITATSTPTCSCPSAQGLKAVPPEASAPVLEQLAAVGYCGPGMACNSLCLCELTQLDGAALQACQTADQPPNVPGFCYLNAVPGEINVGAAQLAKDCVGPAPRRIRFTGGAPAQSSMALLYCPG
jgi:hypothetical protein